MLPDGCFSSGLRSAAIFGAPGDIGRTSGAAGGVNRLIGLDRVAGRDGPCTILDDPDFAIA
jgi:hypothetical protein